MGSYASETAQAGVGRPYKVLVAGCSYSGLAASINLLEQCDKIDDPISVEVTIVDERDGFYHLIGSPLALAVKEYSEKAWVEFKNIRVLQRPNVYFIQGRMSKVDPETKTALVAERDSQTPRELKYDFFIAATGLRRPWPVVPQSLTRKEYLLETAKHIDSVTNSTAPVLVVGGGAVGIEMAAELKATQPHVKVTLAHSRDKLLSAEPLPEPAKECAGDLVVESGVELLLNHRLASSKPIKDEATGREVYEVEFENGHRMVASQVLMAISRSVPSTDFLPQAALSDKGLVNVRASMQLVPAEGVANPDIHFASGDAINWSGIKRCGAAMHEGSLAALNIYQLMLRDLRGHEPVFTELHEIPPMIGLAVGHTALSCGPEGMNHGPQVMKLFFEEDLGFRICWDHLRLGGIKPKPQAA